MFYCLLHFSMLKGMYMSKLTCLRATNALKALGCTPKRLLASLPYKDSYAFLRAHRKEIVYIDFNAHDISMYTGYYTKGWELGWHYPK